MAVLKIWDVAAKDLRQVAKDRGALLMLFVVPLLLVAVLGSVVDGAFTSASKIVVALPVVDHDRGVGARALIAALRRAPSLRIELQPNEAAVKRAVRDGTDDGAVIIPTGFSTSWQSAGAVAHVTYYTVPNNSSVEAQVARDTVQAVVQRMAYEHEMSRVLRRVLASTGGAVGSAETLAATAAAQLEKTPPVALHEVNASGRRVNADQNAVPGYALMFALFGVMAGARTILEEKESGTFRRLLIAPLPPYALLGGKLLSQFVQAMVQISVLFLAGALLFHISLGPSVPALALLVVATSFAATGLGLILVSFIKSERQVRPLTTLIVLSFSALGGSWWPISLEPQWMQNLAKLTVNGWAMDGFNALMIFDKSFMQVLPDIAALFVYGMVCMAIAARTFRFTEA